LNSNDEKSVLYPVLKPIVRISLKAFFRKIVVIGSENLNITGPIIFASNHPNAFLGPILLVIVQQPQLYFLAGAEWFGNGLKGRVFKNDFNMIPVVRPWLKKDGKKDGSQNEEMFKYCHIALSEDKRIVIYPEGTSVTTPKIRDLKTGTARIKLETDQYLEKNGFSKSVNIIPVGMNYYNPRTFQSDVIINVGEPVDFSDIRERDPKKRVQLMTEKIRSKMSELVFHYDDENFTELAKSVFLIYGQKMGVTDENLKEKFRLQKTILNVIHFFRQNETEKFDRIKEKINAIDEEVKKNKLDLRYFNKTRHSYGHIVKIIMGLPLFIAGFVINFLPYRISRWVFEKFLRPKFSTTYEPGKLNPSFLGSMAFLVGMIIFLFWYTSISLVLSLFTGWYFTIPIFLIGSYYLGVFAARYVQSVFRVLRENRVLRLKERKNPVFMSIRKKLDELISEMDTLRKEYDTRIAE
jgi:1-acyl-sn-glycerol-3-phosphate acyltransferase